MSTRPPTRRACSRAIRCSPLDPCSTIASRASPTRSCPSSRATSTSPSTSSSAGEEGAELGRRRGRRRGKERARTTPFLPKRTPRLPPYRTIPRRCFPRRWRPLPSQRRVMRRLIVPWQDGRHGAGAALAADAHTD
eukprot:7381319-Prymnesium_polylepis.1